MSTVAGKGLVDSVVNYFVNEVVKSSFTRRADIHTGTFSDGFESFEYLNRGFVILFGDWCIEVCCVYFVTHLFISF